MRLALSSMISEIDRYAEQALGIPTVSLMHKSGEAIARAVRELTPMGEKVLIFAGKGNNGGDGYAAASILSEEYEVTVMDVFSSGQRSEAGNYFLKEYKEQGGNIIKGIDEAAASSASVLVDAIFGTGFSGTVSEEIKKLSQLINKSHARKIAVDVPLGVNADDGSLADYAISVDVTVALSYIKPGLLSYPARANTGRVILDTLGLDRAKIAEHFEFKNFAADESFARAHLPERTTDGNKGSFGKVLLITGSDKYRGAAHLTLEAALRGGAGLVTYLGSEELCTELRMKYPEAIYESICTDKVENFDKILEISKRHKATLVGSGSGMSDSLARLVTDLLSSEGGALVFDADAINSIAAYGDLADIRKSSRRVILTPHPLEFARLSGLDVTYIQSHRIECAKSFARENRCVLVLKGAATLITDGEELYVNTSGSSALAKAGSGDVLAGLLLSLLGFMTPDAICAALAVYIHGAAGDNLMKILSSYGVTPSDLPREIARVMSELER